MKSYNFQTGAKISSVILRMPVEWAGVKLGGNLALAVSCRLVKGGISFMIAILLFELSSLRLLKLNV